MGKRTTKVRVFTIADYIEEQQWLEQQHRRGSVSYTHLDVYKRQADKR